jgi:hypothetical protein
MVLETATIGEMERICSTFDIPPEIAKPILALFVQWSRGSGVEWAVSRMKDFQVNLVRWLAGELPMYGTWTGVRSDLTPKGPVGALFRWVGCKPTKRRRIHAISLLRMYTKVVSTEVTPKQERKFLSGVLSEPTLVPSELQSGVVEALKRIGAPRGLVGIPNPLYTMIPSATKRHPLPDGTTHWETENLLMSRLYLTETKLGSDLTGSYPSTFRAVCEGLTYFTQGNRGVSFYPFEDSVGKIGLIQEPGFKLRAVANPGRVYQRALQPLGDRLFRVLRSLPWDCTFDQAKPLGVLQEALSAGQTLHCVDLSGATDYFPLDLQLPALDYLTLNSGEAVRLFRDLSRSPWQYGGDTISWKRGQPLGLYPSFAAFALTHGALLYHLNGYRHDNRFFVLGDDVVIADDALASRYREVLEDLGCPVSPNKTLASSRLGEFAGKLVFPDCHAPQLKWREVSDDSFVDFARNFGKKALDILRPRQRKVVKMICTLPDFMGGLGWNPKGLPLEDRVYLYHVLFDRDVSSEGFLMSYDRLINQAVHCPTIDLGSIKATSSVDASAETTIRTFDQKVSALLHEFLPRLALTGLPEVLGRNLKTVAPLGDLPLEGGNSSFRRTMLEVLESKLR